MVKSLVELCTAVCIKNIKDVTDVGNLTYPTLRTIMLQINSARQLRQLEVASPHLEGDDAECWVRLIQRDFPVLAKRHNFAPKNPSSWHRIYARYERLEAEQKREAEEKLKAAFAGIKKEKAENVSNLVDFDRRKLPRPPKDVRGAFGARSKPAAGRRGGGPDESELRFTGGSKTKTTSVKSIVKKARREAREINARNRLATPTGLLPVRRGQIVSAPKAMVEEARIKAQPAIRGGAQTGVLRAPRSSGGAAAAASEQRRSRELEEREARLRRLKAANNATATVVSDSDLEDEGGYGDEDVDDRDDDEDDDDDASDHGYEFNDSGNGGGAGLDADDLEDLFEEKKPSTSTSSSSSSRKPSLVPTPVKPTPVSKTAASPTNLVESWSKLNPTTTSSSTGTTGTTATKRSGILCNAPGSSRMALTKPIPRPRSSSGSVSGSNSSSTLNNKAALASSSKTPSATQQPKKAFSPPPIEKKQQQQQQHSSPPPKQPSSSALPTWTSPELKPEASSSSAPAPASRKRKPVDIFMKPKPKVQKR